MRLIDGVLNSIVVS